MKMFYTIIALLLCMGPVFSQQQEIMARPEMRLNC
jgi:hypothetical protein